MRSDAAELLAIIVRAYGLEGALSPLAGENRNFLLTCTDGRRFVLKIAPATRTGPDLELEDAAIEFVGAHMAGRAGVIALPRTVRTTEGHVTVDVPGAEAARLAEFVHGTPWRDAGPAGPARLRNLGRALATLDGALLEFSPPRSARTHQWDLTRASQHRARVALIDAPDRRRGVEAMFHVWAACAAPVLPTLPHSFIHADANDENVLVDGDRITGLLDFGDALRNPTICELAIALVYAVLDRDDPLAAGADVVAGYHDVRPLSADEQAVLFPLMCGRLAASVTIAAERHRIDPTRGSWFTTEDQAWRLIATLAAIDPVEAGLRLTEKIGAPVASTDGTAERRSRRDPMAVDDLRAARDRHISQALSVSYREPLAMLRGAGQYLYDRRGRPYLDLVNNVCHVGHCHPRVVETASRQIARLNTNTRYLYDELNHYAARLTATLPPSLEVCFFVNSGSEANELALRLARAHTGRRDVLVVDGAYHGNTGTLVAMSPYKFMRKGGAGAPEPWVHVVPMPDGYRGRYTGGDRAAGEAYGHAVGRVIAESSAPIAAFFVESILSCGGQIVLPPGYLETAFAHVRAAGGVCVVDEVQVGFGRVGRHFWGFELQHVVPDIVVMGKPMGNGHPMGAVVTTREIAASFANGMEFFSTFGGNPVSCATGLAVLDVIREEDLQARAAVLGDRFLAGLRALAIRHPIIGDVRGEGLFLGIELVRDRQTLEPAASEATDIVNRAKERGILLSTDGPLDNVIKIKPPMVLTEDDVDFALRVLDAAMGERSSS